MRNKFLALLILLIVSHSFSFAQSRIVEDESLEKLLFDFLIEQNEITKSELEKFTPSITLVNALDYSAFDSTKTGVFKFILAGSHQRPYLFVYDVHGIELIKDYSIQNILSVLTAFFSRNDSLYSNRQKLQCLENVIEIVKTNYKPPGWFEVEDG